MGHFNEIEIGCTSDNFSIWVDQTTPFRANDLLGYAQSGSERTSFSGSTVANFCDPLDNFYKYLYISISIYLYIYIYERSGNNVYLYIYIYVYIYILRDGA